MLRAHPERASMIAEVGQTSRHEEPALVVYVCFLGTDDEGERQIEILRRFKPLYDVVRRRHFSNCSESRAS